MIRKTNSHVLANAAAVAEAEDMVGPPPPYRRRSNDSLDRDDATTTAERESLLLGKNNNRPDEEAPNSTGAAVLSTLTGTTSTPSKTLSGGAAGIPTASTTPTSTGLTKMGLGVLVLLAVQNCSKNLLMRYVMQGQPQFLTSAAVLGSECIKLTCSVLYITSIQKRSWTSILEYLRQDQRNTLLLVVPASAYNLQMSLEYVALAHLSAAVFSVVVQTKLLCTATFAFVVLQKKLKVIQVVSLVLLTTGVMLCNYRGNNTAETTQEEDTYLVGIMATLGIAVSSGFASVYTEKVIKAHRTVNMEDYGLAYTQVQLALMSIVTIGLYATVKDYEAIRTYGLFHNFSFAASLSVLNSAIGGLIVASVLKYADAILKGYATAVSVIATGLLSMVLFGTELSMVYFMGVLNVMVAVILYNGDTHKLGQYMC
jgi:UDP-sugar transporter A1/2/3